MLMFSFIFLCFSSTTCTASTARLQWKEAGSFFTAVIRELHSSHAGQRARCSPCEWSWKTAASWKKLLLFPVCAVLPLHPPSRCLHLQPFPLFSPSSPSFSAVSFCSAHTSALYSLYCSSPLPPSESSSLNISSPFIPPVLSFSLCSTVAPTVRLQGLVASPLVSL